MPTPGNTNNPLGDLPEGAKRRRDQIEEALAMLHTLLIDLDELAVRIEQAIHRTPLVVPVLAPALKRVSEMQSHVSTLREGLASYWNAGQSRRWE